MPKLSIILPIYNVEEYLGNCLNSILSFKGDDIEVILVDDGSPDNCPAICDEYAKKDERIKVVHKENGGASSARNAGIEIATAPYIAFVDPDDEITENYLTDAISSLNENSCTIMGIEINYPFDNYNIKITPPTQVIQLAKDF